METSSLPLTAAGLGIVVDESGCEVDDLVFCGAPEVTVPGSVALDDVVALAVERGWVGTEALAGIPGTLADAVRANASAFGYALADVVSSVRTWDRDRDRQRTFAAVDCGFTAGSSRLAETLDDGRPRFDVLDVRLLFRMGDLTAPVLDGDLAALLRVPPGARVPPRQVRDAVGAAAPPTGQT